PGFAEFTFLRSLNESDQAVGSVSCWYSTGDPQAPFLPKDRAYSWSPTTGLVALSSVSPAASDWAARDVNEAGTVLGWEFLNFGINSLLWTSGGGVTYAYDAAPCRL